MIIFSFVFLNTILGSAVAIWQYKKFLETSNANNIQDYHPKNNKLQIITWFVFWFVFVIKEINFNWFITLLKKINFNWINVFYTNTLKKINSFIEWALYSPYVILYKEKVEYFKEKELKIKKEWGI